LVAEATNAIGTQTNITIVAPGDYQAGQVADQTEPGGATLLRIRGQVDLRAAAAGGVALMAIFKLGALEPSPIMTTALALTSGDVLWEEMVMVSSTVPTHVEVDIKAKRKLENDAVVFSIFSVAVATIYFVNFRALLGMKT